MLRKDEPFKWSSELEVALEKVHSLFIKAVTIAHPVEGRGTSLQADASDGAIASQLY